MYGFWVTKAHLIRLALFWCRPRCILGQRCDWIMVGIHSVPNSFRRDSFNFSSHVHFLLLIYHLRFFRPQLNRLCSVHFIRQQFLQRAQCSHWKRCISYGNSVRQSVRPSVRLSVCQSHAGIVSKRRHVARCSLHCCIAKCVKTRCLQEWVDHLEPKFQGEGVVPREYFLVCTKLDTFCYPTVQTAPCRRFDTIPACDWQTDGRTDRQTELP